MKVWRRCALTTRCGSCGTLIAEGAPVFVLKGPTSREFKRCQSCAGEPVDWDAIEAQAGPPIEPPTFRPVSELAQRFDSKMAQAGDRE
jgi:hypothetical protein